MSVCWSCMVAPRLDGYDIEQLRLMAFERWGYVRPERFEGPMWCDGRLELLADTRDRASFVQRAVLDDPRLVGVEASLKLWPEGYESATRFLDYFTPLCSARAQGRGSTSGHDEISVRRRIGVYVTIDDPIGCAEGILHENAHQRLECMGVSLDQHDGRLITNDFEPRYFSPIRRDVLRPMSALIHGVYAWIWLSELDIAAQRLGFIGAEYARHNIPKVERGLEEIEQGVSTTGAGKQFIDVMLTWGYEVVKRGKEFCERAGFELQRPWERSDDPGFQNARR